MTCGAKPIGTYSDGSPRFGCPPHPPILPGNPRHPGTAGGEFVSLRISLDEPDQRRVLKVAKTVAQRYEKGRTATMKYLPPGRSIVDVNRDGFGAELAVANWSGLEWNRGQRRKPDVGLDVEVRTVRRRDGMLALYTYDKAGRRYVFTIGSFPTYHLVGWIHGREGMIFDYWHPRGAVVMGYTLDVARFLVPVGDLHPMQEFVRAVPEAAEASDPAVTLPT